MTDGQDSGRSPKTLPRPSEADMKRLTGMVKRGELHPMLNHTKWTELQIEMLAAPQEQAPRFRTRSVFAPPGFFLDWDGDFYYHIHPVAELEWMELQAGVVRVWGYTRPGTQPDWQ